MSQFDEAWRWSRRGVEEVRVFFQGLGHYVLDVDAIENGGAPAIIGRLKRHIVPDLQVSGQGTTHWVEVKYKDHCPYYQKTGKHRHGIDLHHWYAYRQVERETGIPGLLAIFQERPGADADPRPVLLVAPFASLALCAQIVDRPVSTFKRGAIFWDVDRFQRHTLEAGRVPNLTRLTEIIHPWERTSRNGQVPQMPAHREPTLFDT